MNINTRLSPVQAGVVVATLAVALGMGIANAAGWVGVYGEPYAYPLALLALGCEVIAVLVLAASQEHSRARARFAVAGLCAVLNVYGGHQFLDLRERHALAQYSAVSEKRATLSRDVQSAAVCIERGVSPSRSRVQNAALAAAVDQCRNDKRAAQSELDALPYVEPPKSGGLILWLLMIIAEFIKILAVYSVTSAPAVSQPARVVSISDAASALARKRHARSAVA